MYTLPKPEIGGISAGAGGSKHDAEDDAQRCLLCACSRIGPRSLMTRFFLRAPHDCVNRAVSLPSKASYSRGPPAHGPARGRARRRAHHGHWPGPEGPTNRSPQGSSCFFCSLPRPRSGRVRGWRMRSMASPSGRSLGRSGGPRRRATVGSGAPGSISEPLCGGTSIPSNFR